MAHFLSLVLALWVVAGYALFRRLPGAYATLFVVIVGQMFLPEVRAIPHTAEAPRPDLLPLVKVVKANVISYALLAGSLACDWRRWRAVTPQWYDLPMLLWCACPLFSSYTNDLGLYDGAAELLQQTIVWGVPYWLGRLYLADRAGLRAWAAAVAVGGTVYTLPCLVEIRLSPQLHYWVYGFHQHLVIQAERGGYFRPTVFMEHGLAVGVFMAAATVCAYWLWREGTFTRFVWWPGWPAVRLGWVVAWLAGVTALCQSAGAAVLGVGAVAALELTRALRTPLVLLALTTVPPIYVAARYTQAYSGQELVTFVRDFVSPDRAESLAFRLRNEDLLVERAKERPAFGWAGHDRPRVKDERGEPISVADSLWVIAAGHYGVVGLTALGTILLLPIVRFACLYPPRRWVGAADAPAAAVAAALVIYAGDFLFNAMVNPIFTLALGGLAGAAGTLARTPVEMTNDQ